MKFPRGSRIVLALFAALAIHPFSIAQQIALTWDDLPAHGALPAGQNRVEVLRQIIGAMKAEKMPVVYGFVNAVQLEREPASAPGMKEWRDAGMLMGNHTWSHMNLNSSSLADWEADLLKDEPALEKYAQGTDWHWLRYPFLAEGDTAEKRQAARQFLASHGYKIAAVTMSFGDYQWNEPYARCLAKSDSAAIAHLETSYIDAAASDAEFRHQMAKSLFGHDIPYVLLMHVGAFDAHMLPRLLQMYRQRGFSFVTLEEAEKDPFYKSSVDPSLPAQPDSLEGAMQQRGLAFPAWPKATADLNSICR